MIIKYKIINLSFSVNPCQNFKTTKKWKKILIGEPSFSLSCLITLTSTDKTTHHVADIIIIGGLLFVVLDSVDGTVKATNYYTSTTKEFKLNINDIVDVPLVYRIQGEGHGKQ